MRQLVRQFRSLNPARLWLCFLTLWFFVVISGLPLPMLKEVIRDSDIAPAASHSIHGGKVHMVGKDRSQPFPCMFSSCGCNTADQCWRQCCCHDLSSKLAWAKRNHVLPPEYVIAEARQKGLLAENESLAIFSDSGATTNEEIATSANPNTGAKPACAHCGAKKVSAKSRCSSGAKCCELKTSASTVATQCSEKDASETKSCCSVAKVASPAKKSCCQSTETSEADATKSQTCCHSSPALASHSETNESSDSSVANTSVIILRAMKCRGELLNMLGFAPMLPIESLDASMPEACLVERLTICSEQIYLLSLDVLTPPPWV